MNPSYFLYTIKKIPPFFNVDLVILFLSATPLDWAIKTLSDIKLVPGTEKVGDYWLASPTVNALPFSCALFGIITDQICRHSFEYQTHKYDKDKNKIEREKNKTESKTKKKSQTQNPVGGHWFLRRFLMTYRHVLGFVGKDD